MSDDFIHLPGKEAAARTLLWRRGQALSLETVLAMAGQLAQHLPAADFALNLCTGRLNFIVGAVAAGLRRQTTLLPHSPIDSVVTALRARHPSHHVLDDRCLDGLDWPSGISAPISLPADTPALTLHTSGSTGVAQAHARSWRELAAIGRLDAQRLLPHGAVNLVASVPSQHMYGLQTAVLLPLFGGCAIHDSRPLFPADIAAALAGLPPPRALVTTPVHLRACLAAHVNLPELQFVLCATAPLETALAQRVEQAWHTRVFEILGSTETATIGTRRTTDGPLWQLLPGTRLETADSVSVLHASHLVAPVALADILSMEGPGHFRLLGRAADQVKIAGKRASLAELTRQLLTIPGVVDGVIFLPPGAQRTAALVVAPGLRAAALLDALAQRVDTAFVPRPLRLVHSLPRGEVGKLPQAALLEALRAANSAPEPS